jgi:hypothetical protein
VKAGRPSRLDERLARWPSALSMKRPSAVSACANRLDAPALCAHRLTTEPTIGASASATGPLIVSAAANVGALHHTDAKPCGLVTLSGPPGYADSENFNARGVFCGEKRPPDGRRNVSDGDSWNSSR